MDEKYKGTEGIFQHLIFRNSLGVTQEIHQPMNHSKLKLGPV